MNYCFNYFVDQFSHSVWPFFLKLKGKVFLCSGSWKKVFWAMLLTKPFWWPLTFTMGHTETFLKICLYGLQREKILLDQCLLFLTTICWCLTIRQWLQTWAPTKPLILSKPRQHVKRANLVDSLYPYCRFSFLIVMCLSLADVTQVKMTNRQQRIIVSGRTPATKATTKRSHWQRFLPPACILTPLESRTILEKDFHHCSLSAAGPKSPLKILRFANRVPERRN